MKIIPFHIKLLVLALCLSVPLISSAETIFTNGRSIFITHRSASANPAPVKLQRVPFVPAHATNGWIAPVAHPASLSAVRKVRLVSGGARADFGIHKVVFSANAGEARPIGITTPDGQSLWFRPTSLVYYDTSSGKSVALAEIKDCIGGVRMPDHVIYQNAFSDVNADIEYHCGVNSLEQNIILHQRPPAPEDLGLNPATTRLEMWTEWFNTTPRKQEHSIITLRAKSDTLNATLADDASLDFGTMKIVRGKAFNLDAQANSMPVAKEWQQIEGRNFLLEVVDYKAIEQSLKTLPQSAALPAKQAYLSRERLVRSLAGITNPIKREQMQLAKVETKAEQGVVLDFTIIASIPLPQGAISWWPAGGDANDAIGGNNGTLNDVYFGAGEVGQAFGFNTDGAAARIPANTNLDVGQGDGFTIECWVNPTSASVWGSVPLVEWNDGSWWGVHFFINDYYGTPGNFFANIADTDGGWHHINSGGGVVSNEFQHLALTYDKASGIADLYRNGVLVTEENLGSFTPQTSYDLYFGQRPNEGITYSGLLDEVTLYNRALSSSEIADIYNAGGAGKFNPNCVSPSTNAVGWWPGDGNTYDLARTNLGILRGAATYSSGKVGQAFDLDGNDSCVEIPDSDAWAFGANDFSIEFWVDFRDLGYGNLYYPEAIFVANDEGGGDLNKWIFGLSERLLTLLVDDPVTGVHFLGQVPFEPDLNTWYHVALVRDGNTLSVYENGILAGTDTINLTIQNPNGPLTIGQAEGISFVNGLIDEMTIYNRALTGTEISTIYTAGCAGKCKVDLDNDGLPDWWEWKYFGNLDQTGSGDYDGDGISNYREYVNNTNPTNFDNALLGHWPFDNTNTWAGAQGQLPLLATNVVGVPSWNTNAVKIDSTNVAILKYRDVETDGNANINLRNGTIRFWFKPDWSSGTGPGSQGRLIEMGNQTTTNSWWSLVANTNGTQLAFGTQTNGLALTNLSVTISWSSNEWHQIVLTYSPTNSSLYLDGQPIATNGTGTIYYPNAVERANGFRIGSDANGANQAKGTFEELETFNYPLAATNILTNYQTITQFDSDLDGVPNVQDADPNNPNVGILTITIDNPMNGAVLQ